MAMRKGAKIRKLESKLLGIHNLLQEQQRALVSASQTNRRVLRVRLLNVRGLASEAK
jgi:hypothetical protein